MFLTISYYQFFPENELKSLTLQLRELLRIKKPKPLNKVKAYLRIGRSDWRNVTYLKGVDSIPYLDVDEDNDSICTVSTTTTDIDADTDLDLDSGVPAVGSPAVVGVPAVGDMAFGDMYVSDTAIGGSGKINPAAEVDPVVFDSTVVDPADGGYRAEVDHPFQVDPNDENLADFFWVDREMMDGESADCERNDFKLVNGESTDDVWGNLDRTYGESADGERIGYGLSDGESADCERIDHGLSDGQSADDEWVDGDSSEHYWSDSNSDFKGCGPGGACHGQQRLNGEAPDINYDFFLTTLRNRLRRMTPSTRMTVIFEIFGLLKLFEQRVKG